MEKALLPKPFLQQSEDKACDRQSVTRQRFDTEGNHITWAKAMCISTLLLQETEYVRKGGMGEGVTGREEGRKGRDTLT